MSRIILMAVVLAVTVAGCNRFPDLTVQINANLLPEQGACSVTPEQEGLVGIGRLDLAVAVGYSFTGRIESYLIDNSLDFQADQGNYQVTSYDVTIKLPDGTVPELSGGLPNPYNVLATSSLIRPSEEPGGSSLGTAYAEVIPPSYGQALIDLVNGSGFNSIQLDLRANGETSGGFAQSSPPFRWPIELCAGCLEDCSEEAVEQVQCFPGQDSWTYCTTPPPPDGT